MNGPEPRDERANQERRIRHEIARRVERKRRAAQQREGGVWFGLGMFGLVGWSVAIPTLAGVALGVWIDTTWPSRYSWTLMFLVAGLAAGCLNAWYWVNRERRSIETARDEREPADDE